MTSTIFCFILHFQQKFQQKKNVYGNPPEANIGNGGKDVKQRVVHSIMFYYDLLCSFKLYLSTKIEPYLIYDILVIICMVIIVGSYIIVNFGYNIVSYKIPVIILYIIFFPL